MIPNEVVIIAQEIAIYAGYSAKDWKQYETLAWRIYNRLILEAKALKSSYDPPDD